MNITGIITEYNPFHNGHKYHLNEARKATNADGIICIMSGNFVQRGGPAIVDKWQRAAMAVENGVDLVIELPTYYAVSSAEFFAKGSVSILNSLGVVNNLFFGSECGDVSTLEEIAKFLTIENSQFKSDLKDNLNQGLTYAKARENALINHFQNINITEVISSSNNILGIEYIKALIKFNSKIKAYTLKREGSNYNDKTLSNTFSSATSIREALKNNLTILALQDSLPNKTIDIFTTLQNTDYPFAFDEDMFKFIKFKLLTHCVNFNNLSEVIEGLENKFMKEIYTSNSYEEFILKVKSKRYTYSKISRILTQIYIGLDNVNFDSTNIEELHYCRILAFNQKGREILSLIKKHSTIPLITKVPKHPNNALLELDISATRAYSIVNDKLNPNADFLLRPIIKD